MAPTLFSEASPLDTSVFRLSTPVKRGRPIVTESLLAAVIAATPLDVRLGGLRRLHVWASAPPFPEVLSPAIYYIIARSPSFSSTSRLS